MSLRVEYLESCSIPERLFTCIEHAPTGRKLGVFLQPTDLGEGEVDTSNLLVVDNIIDPDFDDEEEDMEEHE